MFSLPEFEKAKDYWLDKLSGTITEARVPMDYLQGSDYKKGSCKFYLDDKTAQKLCNIGKCQDIAIYTLLTTILNILVYKYTNQNDILVGVPVYTDSEEMCRYNSLIFLRTVIDSNMSFKETLIDVKGNLTEGYGRQHYPFQNLMGLLQMEDGFSPLRIISLMENIHKRTAMEEVAAPYGNDLTFSFLRKDLSIEVTVIYNKNLYKNDSITRLFQCYTYIMGQALSNINIRIAEIELIPQEEREWLNKAFNSSYSMSEDETIGKLFREQVEKTSDNIAVSCFSPSEGTRKWDSLTYRELFERSNQLAGVLREKGVKAGSIVGLILERSVDMVIGIMGIIIAGGAYLPVDPEYPTERINFILSDSGANLLVTREKLTSQICFQGEIIDIDDQSIMGEKTVLEEINLPGDLAYVIYTSGSTGKPKGVMIEHGSVANFAKWRIKQYGYSKRDTTLQLISASFDGFGANLYSSLLSGGTLIMVRGNSWMDFAFIKDVICDNQVTNMSVVPSMYKAILDTARGKELESLRFVVLAGEKSDDGLVELSSTICPHTKLINEYGPTENTIATTSFIGMHKGKTSIIGRPVCNHTVHIFNKDYNLMPVGVPGELCVSGKGLGRGYVNDQKLTQEKFVNITGTCGSIRIYRTGDRAKWLPDGNIEFLGRMDEQIKIRGYRVELGEIENRLMECPSIKDAIVVHGDNNGVSKSITAYVTSHKSITEKELRDHLSVTLPEYMIPSFFIQLDKIPLTPNGKVDRKLLVRGGSNINTGESYHAPRNELERMLVEIWQLVLEREKVGINDKFIDIGGDSMKAVSISMECEKHEIKLSASDIFSYRTISKIAENIEFSNKVTNSDAREDKVYTTLGEGNKMINRLEIKLQRDITTYLHRSLPLCAILAREESYQWYYQHYVQIFSIKYGNGFCRIEFLEAKNNYSEIFDEIYLPYQDVDSSLGIIDFIRNQIDNGFYVAVNLDEYYLPDKSSYKKLHFVHPSLIFGYDNKDNRLMAIGFDAEGIFRELSLQYHSFIEAYEGGKRNYRESAPWAEKEAIQLLKLKTTECIYSFEINKFMEEIDCYLRSSDANKSRIYGLISQEELQSASEIRYGAEVYNVILEALKTLSPQMITIDYRTIHLLYEHKKCIYDRLKYVAKISKSNVESLLDKYLALVERLNAVRLKFFDLEHMFTTGIGLNEVSQQELVGKVVEMISIIEEVGNEEPNLLGNIYKILQHDKRRF